MDRTILNRDFSEYVGLKFNADVTKETFLALKGVNTVRVLYPNSIMTMDLRYDRMRKNATIGCVKMFLSLKSRFLRFSASENMSEADSYLPP